MTAATTRLHITPLTPELLPVILGPASNRIASAISYHEIQTFPEKNYGYVDLPTMEAEKLKKKLNGSILKGKKIKIEDAKPRKRKVHELDSSAEAGDILSKPDTIKKEKKSKKEKNVLPGHELSPERKVKRGWTEPKKTKADKKGSDKADRQKSKYTDKEELLFRTNVPPSKAGAASDSKKSKKSRSARIVHEFEKSTAQPSFLKQSGSDAHPSLEYVDGQGWLDAAGNTVEAEPSTVANRRISTKKARKLRSSQIELTNHAPSPKNQSKSARTESQDRESNAAVQEDSSSSLDSEDAETRSSSSAPPTPPTTQDLVPEETAQAEVHPLEALFKKPQRPASSQDVAKPSLELATSNFSFFDADAGDDVEEDPNIPGTPHTSQELRARGLRSAAPTPDTAHPSRFNSYGSTGLPGDEEEDSEDDAYQQPTSSTRENALSQLTGGQGQPSDFEKMFWEKRGENNRAWKARRRTVLKEKRQRENRSRRLRNW
jgi:hypothetical protein